MTIQRHLHRMGYRNILPQVTHMLTKEQKEKRVTWAMMHKNDDWNQTVFSDESYFQLFKNPVRRRSETLQKKLKRIPKNKQNVMVWGAIRAKDKISCHTFRSNMDALFYIKTLQIHLLPAARQQYAEQWRFQQDNDPKHRSKVAKEFLDREVPKTIDWPPNSPNLNPIENMWSILKRRVEKQKPSGIDELETTHEEWQKVDICIVNNLTGSMKTRCLTIIDSGGKRISY